MNAFTIMTLAPIPFLLCVSVCAALPGSQLWAGDLPRERLSLDANWKFHLGDDWPGALHLHKAGTSSGPASERFPSDMTWRTINLPHDWAIELPFDRAGDGNHGFKPIGPGFERTSIAWYRREFQLPAEDSGKRIGLTFDGVFRDATVWVNGWLVRRHEGGYSPFREDITNVVRFGGRNTIAVRADATKFEGWFYEGAGIYRHVWLEKTAPVAIAPDGIFVYSRFPNNLPSQEAQISVEASVLNTLVKPAAAIVDCEIVSPDGQTVARFKKSAEVAGQSQETVALQSPLASPVLWSPATPALYTLITTVTVEHGVVDRTETPFGVRTVGFDPKQGFLLNGKRYELHGTCNHQDHAGVGVAVPNALQDFRVKRLKEMGCNAYRSAHNPATPELLDACDRLGMLVMDESRLLGSDSENLRKWADQIRRARNHPSVVIWSIANEEHLVQETPQATGVALAMQNCAKKLDPTRPVTYAAPQANVFRGINSVIEVRGWNYNYGPCMDEYHAEHPDQPNVGTEQASVVGTRGVYVTDWSRGRINAYDVRWPGWQATAESWWTYFAERPWLSGGFAWTGFDYRGESSPCTWPSISSHFGILDTCGFPKDSFYYYKSWWTNETVLHLAPHWNWPGKEGQEIRVEAQSNCRQVELFLNGASLGRQTMKPYSKLVWQVKYASGTLSAKGFDGAGNVVVETKVETTGEPARIQLTPDRSTLNADGEDVVLFMVAALDAQGRIVPLAQNKIHFAIEGAGRIIGVGNGDPTCHEPDTYVPSRRSIAIGEWRWKPAPLPTTSGESVPEVAPEFDDSSWTAVKPGELPMKENETAIYRAHVTLSQHDLDAESTYVSFGAVDDHGRVFVNGQFIGESHGVQEAPVFEIKEHLRVGDNVIAVGVKNDAGPGGVNPRVSVVVCKPVVEPWSRSLFNGLAQIIVQSTREPGELRLTARSSGLAPATDVVHTQPCTPRPAAP